MYNKVIHWKKEIVDVEVKTPYEVKQMESLVSSTWWGMITEKLNKRLEEYKNKIIKQRPAWATDSEKIAAYEFMVRTNDIILEIENLKSLPNILINEYSNENFTGGVNT